MTTDSTEDALAAPVNDGGTRVTSRRRALSRRDAWFGIAFVLGALFYLWTLLTSGTIAQYQGDATNYYALLTTAFLHGHLGLLVKPPAGLLALRDPYNPAANGLWQSEFHDLALYHGRFYLDWGPTPVLTLYLPWHLLALGDLPERWAVWIYSTAGLAFALLFLRTLVSTYAPRARTSRVVIGAVAVATGSVLPFLNRTPDIYEVATASAYCFLVLGLYLLARGGLGGRRSPWRLGIGSLALGLAAGGRWDLLFAAGLLLPLCLFIARRDHLRAATARLRLASLVIAPGALFIALLLLYNFARFHNPLEVGTTYQLAGFDPTKTPYYLLSYLWPSLYYYVIAPVRWTLQFPYVALPPPPSYPGAVPPSYSPEIIGGILTTTPVLLFLLAIPFVGRRRSGREWRFVSLALIAESLCVIGLIALGVPGGSMRYEVDFATTLLVPALVAWVLAEPERRWQRRLLGAAGSVLVLYGALVALGISLSGYHDQIINTDSGQVAAIEDVVRPLTEVVTNLLGHPVLIGAGCDAGLITTPRYDTLGVGSVTYGVIGTGRCSFELLSPGRGTWTLSMNASEYPGLPLRPRTYIVFVIDDATGAHRYTYLGGAGSVNYPLHLAAGHNVISLVGRARTTTRLAHDTPLVAISNLTIGPPQITP